MTPTADYVTPGHPVRDGAGYDCSCGECLRARRLIAADAAMTAGDTATARVILGAVAYSDRYAPNDGSGS